MDKDNVEENEPDLSKDSKYMADMNRLIGAVGLDTMMKFVKLKIFIFGLRGVGLETAKNLILAGPKMVTVCDDNLVTWGDLGTNFFAKEKDVGKVTRSECVIGELK